jgi:hypothetical protein
MAGLFVDLDTVLPSTFAVGRGNHLFIRGRCYDADEPLRELFVDLGGRRTPVAAHSVAVSDAVGTGPPVAWTSAFWAHVPIPRIDAPRDVVVSLEAMLRDGRVEHRDLGRVTLVPEVERPALTPAAQVVICSVVSGTSRNVLERQLASFRESLTDWHWLVVDDRAPEPVVLDDAHVTVVRNPVRLGPLASFERAIASCDADLIAVDCGGAPIDGPLVAGWMAAGAAAIGAPGGLLGTGPSEPCMIERSLVDTVLPFPPDAGAFDISRWVTACARRPDGRARTRRSTERRIPRSRAAARRALADKAKDSSAVVSIVLAQAAVCAKTLLLRGVRDPALERLAGADRSLLDLSRSHAGASLLGSLLALRLLTLRLRTRSAPAAPARTLQQTLDAQLAKLKFDMAPLKLDVRSDAPRRVNMVVPMIDFRYVFGAYLMIFHLALALRDRGIRVRLLIVQEPPRSRERWIGELRRAPGLDRLLDAVEIVDATDRSRAVEVSAGDVFLATTSWTAHVAAAATKQLGRERFPFLVMEYDPLVFPTGSRRELSAAAYDAPHDAIFSTGLLARYFGSSGLGVYRHGGASVVIDNPVDVQTLDAGAMRGRRRLLFYARPEDHAQRNLFELGVLALERASFSLKGWDVEGVGALEPVALDLASDVELTIHPRVSLDAYLELLPRYDVGLALQATPHPGLVALDMAAAGLVVVTNTFATKNADDLTKISPNILAPPPRVADVAKAIAAAVERAADIDARISGANLNWPRTWSEALPPSRIDEILSLPSFRS